MASDSLNIAAGALDAYQSDISVISNDIANVGTTGFKSQTMEFQDAFYQNLTSATAPTTANGGIDAIQQGVGVKTASTDTDYSEGTINTTGVSTNLALDGDGFFIMNNVDGSGSPSYTRNGDFTINQDGVLVDPSDGLAVQGYNANSAGVLPPVGGVPSSVVIPIGLNTAAVGTGFGAKTGPSTADDVYDVVQGGNLNASNWQTAAVGGTPVNQTSTTTIYDSLGGSHLATYTYNPAIAPVVAGPPVAAGALPATVTNASGTAVVPATAWQVSVSFTDGTQVTDNTGATGATATIGYVYFDANGQYINTSSVSPATAAGAAITVPDTHTVGSTTSTQTGDSMDIASWGTGNNSTAPTATGAAPSVGPIGMSFANLTSLAGTGQAVTTVSQNGYPQGTLSTLSIGQDGTVTGSYSNGLQKTLARVAVAAFENEQGLERSGANQLVPTADSGLAQVGVAGQGRFGQIISNSLEASNVSIADQFSKLIIAQNAYIANSKSITIGNQDLQTIDQLIT